MKNFGKTRLFITGIDTDVGKTIVSSIIVKALTACYWKPIQCGLLPQTDTQLVSRLTGFLQDKILDETYIFGAACSPHIAAKLAGKCVELSKLVLPDRNNHLIVEGAGGCMTPVNDEYFMVDLVKQLNIPAIVVSKHYIGSINHTLATVLALRHFKIQIKGLVFSGKEDTDLEKFISHKTDLPVLFRVDKLNNLNEKTISQEASKISVDLQKWI